MNTRGLGALIIGLVSVSIGTWVIAARPELALTGNFLFADEGHNLWLADVLAQGGRLYVDAFSPYGPLPVWTYAAATSIAGNWPAVYQAFLLGCSLVAILLVYTALSRYLSEAGALAWTLFALVPTMLAPGSLLGSMTVSPYVGLERIAIACALALWQPMGERSTIRAVGMGLALGSLQWIRFGPAPVLIGALVLADVFEARRSRRAMSWRALGVTISTALALEALLAVWALVWLPSPIALDLLWPGYMVEAYSWVTSDLRWPVLSSWRLAVGQYGPPIGGLILIAVAFTRDQPRAEHVIAAWLVLAFALGTLVLFKHAFHFRQYAWLLAAAGGFALASGSRRRWAVATCLVLPTAVVSGRALLVPASNRVAVDTPRMGRLYLTPEEAAALVTLNHLRSENADKKGIVGAPHMSGWHTAFGVPAVSRHTWFQAGMVRPWEASQMASLISGAAAIAVCPLRLPLKDPMPLPAVVQAAVEVHLPVVTIEGGCVVRRPQK